MSTDDSRLLRSIGAGWFELPSDKRRLSKMEAQLDEFIAEIARSGPELSDAGLPEPASESDVQLTPSEPQQLDRPARRIVVAIDIASFARASYGDSLRTRALFATRLEDAVRAAGFNLNGDAIRHDTGDGALLVFPSGPFGIPGVVRFIESLSRQFESQANLSDSVRLRVAIAEGVTVTAANGATGAAVATAARMSQAAEVKESDESLSLITTGSVYESLVGFGGLRNWFARSISVRQKGEAISAYLIVRNRPPSDDLSDPRMDAATEYQNIGAVSSTRALDVFSYSLPTGTTMN